MERKEILFCCVLLFYFSNSQTKRRGTISYTFHLNYGNILLFFFFCVPSHQAQRVKDILYVHAAVIHFSYVSVLYALVSAVDRIVLSLVPQELLKEAMFTNRSF